MENYPNEGWPILIFSLLSAGYFYLKYKNKVKEGDAQKESNGLMIGYVILLVAGQIMFNYFWLTNEVCGEPQLNISMYMTFVPWIFIFGTLNLLLYKYPGWLQPFSNTIGYYFVSSKLKPVFDAIIKPSTTSTTSTTNPLASIYNDSANQALLVNEIPPNNEGFDTFWKAIDDSKLLNKTNPTSLNEAKSTLKNLVMQKNIVSEFIWNLLAGILVILMSYNYVLTLPIEKCSLSPEEIASRDASVDASQNASDNTNSQ